MHKIKAFVETAAGAVWQKSNSLTRSRDTPRCGRERPPQVVAARLDRAAQYSQNL
jgi:hypothetical protein